MPYIPGTKQLLKKARDLQTVANAVQDKVTVKRGWLDRQSVAYRESPQGQEWEEYLENLDDFLNEIMAINTDEV